MLSSKSILEKNNSQDKKNKAKFDDTKQIEEEEFMVFRLNGQGGINLVEENSPPPNQVAPKDVNHNNPKISKKLAFDGNSKGLRFKVNKHGVMISDDEGEERSNVESSKKLPSSDVMKGERDDIDVITEIEASTEHKTLSESTRSDSSAGSFAFPIVKSEMNGSPEKMPKYNDHKKMDRILRFPCCKF